MSQSNKTNKKQTTQNDQKPNRPSWDETYFAIADIIAKRSKDPKTKVGAVLVKEKSVIGLGYNAEPRNSVLVFNWHTEEKYKYVIHAEINAVANASRLGINCGGADIYITHSPCTNCVNTLIQHGIKRIFYRKPYVDFEISKKIALAAGIELIQIDY